VKYLFFAGVVALGFQGSWGWPASSCAAEPEKPGAAINGFRFEFPCKDPMPENPKEGADGPCGLVTGDPKTTDNFTVQKAFGGEKGKRYQVTLRFRGVVEPMMYKGGKQVGEYFYIGGEKNNDTYNVYKLASHLLKHTISSIAKIRWGIRSSQSTTPRRSRSMVERRSPFTAMGRTGV